MKQMRTYLIVSSMLYCVITLFLQHESSGMQLKRRYHEFRNRATGTLYVYQTPV